MSFVGHLVSLCLTKMPCVSQGTDLLLAVLHAIMPGWKLQIKTAISPSHSELTQGQPVLALTVSEPSIYCQAAGRVVSSVPVYMSVVWLDWGKWGLIPVFPSSRQMPSHWAIDGGEVVVVCWLLKVSATCECISGMDLLVQFDVLPHWDRSCRANFPSHPVSVYWHWANQSQHWPYNARRLAGSEEVEGEGGGGGWASLKDNCMYAFLF